jgi:pimeloyl-ACP methyl ester carboxylesterase
VALVESIGQPVVLVGASLGGLSSMMALDREPGLPAIGLVLVDVAHRFHQPGARRITDFMGSGLDGFDDLDQAAAAVAAYQPHRGNRDPAGLRRNLRERDGRLKWHWDPAIMDAATNFFDAEQRRRVEERLAALVGRLEIPIRLVRGGDSDVVTGEIADELRGLNPRADVIDVAGARHMVAGDRNDAFAAAVVDFLETRCRVSAS